MLYFDYNPKESRHYGTIRAQIWAILHFPFHVSLILILEGVKQMLMFQNIVKTMEVVFAPLNALNDAGNYAASNLFTDPK